MVNVGFSGWMVGIFLGGDEGSFGVVGLGGKLYFIFWLFFW